MGKIYKFRKKSEYYSNYDEEEININEEEGNLPKVEEEDIIPVEEDIIPVEEEEDVQKTNTSLNNELLSLNSVNNEFDKKIPQKTHNINRSSSYSNYSDI